MLPKLAICLRASSVADFGTAIACSVLARGSLLPWVPPTLCSASPSMSSRHYRLRLSGMWGIHQDCIIVLAITQQVARSCNPAAVYVFQAVQVAAIRCVGDGAVIAFHCFDWHELALNLSQAGVPTTLVHVLRYMRVCVSAVARPHWSRLLKCACLDHACLNMCVCVSACPAV